jgi:hypothetical protein
MSSWKTDKELEDDTETDSREMVYKHGRPTEEAEDRVR